MPHRRFPRGSLLEHNIGTMRATLSQTDVESLLVDPSSANRELAAAKIAMAAGCHMVIADGTRLNPLAAVADGARCTWFVASSNPKSQRKQWIAASLEPAGCLVIDAGAMAALNSGKSLLPAGVVAVEGEFGRGDPVTVRGPGGVEAARGLCAYSAADARRIAGHKSREIERLLGYRGREEMIHRDDLAMLQ